MSDSDITIELEDAVCDCRPPLAALRAVREDVRQMRRECRDLVRGAVSDDSDGERAAGQFERQKPWDGEPDGDSRY